MDDKAFDGLNMVPFIDIMLVLLTIVLTTSSFIASGHIPVNLPQASSAPAGMEKMETVEIDAAGAIHHGGDQLTPQQFRERLATLDRGAPYLLRADRTVPLQRFIDVADALKQAGVARVAVQTEAVRP